jgi:hypothetical protein
MNSHIPQKITSNGMPLWKRPKPFHDQGPVDVIVIGSVDDSGSDGGDGDMRRGVLD